MSTRLQIATIRRATNRLPYRQVLTSMKHIERTEHSEYADSVELSECIAQAKAERLSNNQGGNNGH